MEKIEIWKDITGFEGLYQVSNLGNVKSLERDTYTPNGVRNGHIKEHLVSQSDNGKGYKKVSLYKDNQMTNKYIHRLVAEAFIPNPENKPQIDHIDTNRANNCVDNLKWTTQTENNLNPLTRNKKLGNITNGDKVIKCSLEGEPISSYRSMREAERENNISNGGLSQYFRKGYSQCGGYTWRKI